MFNLIHRNDTRGAYELESYSSKEEALNELREMTNPEYYAYEDYMADNGSFWVEDDNGNEIY